MVVISGESSRRQSLDVVVAFANKTKHKVKGCHTSELKIYSIMCDRLIFTKMKSEGLGLS